MDPDCRECISFAELFEAELDSLQKRPGDDVPGSDVTIDAANAEPRVRFSPESLVGLALSGGGIRSATFGLGLLIGLDYYRVLHFVDYLSTVSGGGYIGGWLSAWHGRHGNETLRVPASEGAPEAPAVRHLREFSQFLVPRVGIVEMDLWEGIISLVGGVLVSLTAAILVLSGALSLWLAFLAASWAKSRGDWLGLTSIGSATFGFLAFYEAAWRAWKRQKRESKRIVAMLVRDAAVSSAVAGVWAAMAPYIMIWANKKDLSEFVTPTGRHTATAWLTDPEAMPLWSAPALAWLVVALSLLFVRFLTSRLATDGWIARARELLDLATARLLVLAVAWLVLAVTWWLGRYCFAHFNGLGGLLTGGGGLTLIFTLLQRWFARAPSQVQADRLAPKLRSFLVQLLAYALVLFGAALASIAVIEALDGILADVLGPTSIIKLNVSDGRRLIVALLLLVFLDACVLLFIAIAYDPEKMGLHPFYRDRIVRAYLGASNGPERSRQVEVAAGDDLPLTDLRGRPVHLVCCAANGLTDDPLATLDRGCRSAVASQVGFSIGGSAIRWDPTGEEVPRLGSFLTASAAALNPMMGSVSKRLGHAVTFLLAALNVRLGLWVAAPASGGPTTNKEVPFVGWLFFKEMFGLSSCRVAVDAGNSGNLAAAPPQPKPRRSPWSDFVHLSDGGHFENTAVYELVRRHCRYIIVSDAGADPDVAFDDFGNAIRRIREDFGVEIEIDLEPLKPGPDRRAKQHMVVGTIHYDVERADIGLLLYFKPSLTGDEPYDVYQYSVRNQSFPHESTGDQFYDEAQWEAYRKLGEHVARTSLKFFERIPQDLRNAQTLFGGARTQWYPTPEDFQSNFTKLTERYTQLEAELREAAPLPLFREVFPELNDLSKPEGQVDPEWEKSVHFLLEMTQLMEDVWVNCNLDTHSNHPLNGGWVNLFLRWVNTASFQLWWPVLKPLYGVGFRDWVKDLMGRLPTQPDAVTYSLEPQVTEKQIIYTFRLESTKFKATQGEKKISIPAGSVEIALDQDQKLATWSSNDFVVFAGLWGTGIGTRFLADVAHDLRDERGMNTCEVLLPDFNLPDDNSRRERTDLIEFYSNFGFHPSPKSRPGRILWCHLTSPKIQESISARTQDQAARTPEFGP